ncbi:glycosyltransferase [Brachybacterium massiliense]|uniref:glycosyltransferase n=1 Tax=Brachybacterium massiliense TaxID=1755098 RepID=UPI001FE92FEF|nr:glycosyltransferase [Brachybacterium massiliense]
MSLRIAIAHDYLTQRGGAERVVLSLSRAFPDAEIHTLFYEPEQTYPEFRALTIRTSALNAIGMLRRDPRLALPILAPAASRMRIDADVVIASSSGWAHAFPSAGYRVIYCHSPARWLYLAEDYLHGTRAFDPRRIALRALGPLLRRWDRRAALQAHRYHANSSVVRERIRTVYGIDAPTIFPPFSAATAEGEQRPIPELAGWAGDSGAEGGHHLVVSRLQPYKHVDVVIEAFRQMPERRLLVVGRGPEGARLRALAPANVRLVEGIDDAQMRWAYGNAAALVAASHEDFGLTPLEAGAHGVPTLALRRGGYLDSVTEGVNGLFFERPAAEDVRGAVERSARQVWDRQQVREHALQFAEDIFIERIRRSVAEVSGSRSLLVPDDDDPAPRQAR